MKFAPTALVAAALAAGVILAPIAQAAGTDTLFVPGTGSTKPNAPDTIDAAWLDGGRWGTEPVYCICDSNDYPAELGPGVGQASADKGKEATVQFLLAHPKVTNVIGGSQGAGVAYEAIQDPRLAGREFNIVLYSNMDSAKGMRARAVGVKNIPAVGIDGQPPVDNTDPTKHVTEINHEWDPVANAPKYQGSWLWTVPEGVAGFLVYHGALGGPYGSQQIDYRDAKIETVGGRTVITIRDPLTPITQLAAILVGNVAGPQAQFVFTTLAKPADDILGGFLKATGGYDEKGGATVAPTSAGEIQRAVQRFAKGFEDAGKDFAAIPQRLAKGPLPKITTPPTLPAASDPAPAPTASVTLNAEQTAKAITPAKEVKPVKPVKKATPKLGGPGNPVHDTVKTVQGMLNNTVKTWAPKQPKKAAPAKAPAAAKATS